MERPIAHGGGDPFGVSLERRPTAPVEARLRCPVPGWVHITASSSHPPEFQRGVPELLPHALITCQQPSEHNIARLIRAEEE
ncbi:unnamed protein product [Boreogadus saida]